MAKKTKAMKYTGVQVDAIAGLNQSTRRAWSARGILDGDAETGYGPVDLMRAAVGAELVRHGINAEAVSRVIRNLAVEVLEGYEGRPPSGPSYMIASPPPSDRVLTAAPAGRRMLSGSVGLCDGNGALVLTVGHDAADLAEHFVAMARTGNCASVVIDLAGLLRRVLARIETLNALEQR